MTREGKFFRFESAWLTHADFSHLMSDKWQCNGGLEENLATMKNQFLRWSAETFGSVKKKNRQLLACLDGIQRQQYAGNMNRFLYRLEKELQLELHDILYLEELLGF